MTNSEYLFSEMKPGRLFFKTAIPGAVSMFMSSLYILIDGVLVGNVLGNAAFAALNLAFPFVLLNFALSDMVGVGSSVSIGVLLGKKKNREACNVFSCSCLLVFLCGLAIGTLLYCTAPWIMAVMGAEGELAELAASYLRIYALCSPVTTIAFSADNYLRICGKIKYSMNLNVLMAVITMLLEGLFLLIFRWGLWAAAFANCCATMLCALLSMLPFFRGREILSFCKPKFSVPLVRDIVSGGAPKFLQSMAGRLTSLATNAALISFGGTNAVSVYGVLMYTKDLIWPILFGMYGSIQPAISFNYGRGSWERIREIEKWCFGVNGGLGVLAAILIAAFPKPVIRLFVGGMEPEVLNLSVFALRIFTLTLATKWVSFGVQSFFTAIKQPKNAACISLSTALIFPLLFLGIFYSLGLTGIWMIYPATSVAAGILGGYLLWKWWKQTE